jgi:hypothetical protein
MAATSLAEGGAASRLMIAPEVAAAADGEFGTAMEQLAAGRRVLLVDGSGVIRAGTRGVANLTGDTLYLENRSVGVLGEHGYLYRTGSSEIAGRLRGAIPGRDVWLEFQDGRSAPNLRPMMVNVLSLNGGRYLIELADGSRALVPVAAIVGLAVMAANDGGNCDPGRGAGVLIRTSGEPVGFATCERQDDVLVLRTGSGTVLISPDQVHEIIYGSTEVRFAGGLIADSRS